MIKKGYGLNAISAPECNRGIEEAIGNGIVVTATLIMSLSAWVRVLEPL